MDTLSAQSLSSASTLSLAEEILWRWASNPADDGGDEGKSDSSIFHITASDQVRALRRGLAKLNAQNNNCVSALKGPLKVISHIYLLMVSLCFLFVGQDYNENTYEYVPNTGSFATLLVVLLLALLMAALYDTGSVCLAIGHDLPSELVDEWLEELRCECRELAEKVKTSSPGTKNLLVVVADDGIKPDVLHQDLSKDLSLSESPQWTHALISTLRVVAEEVALLRESRMEQPPQPGSTDGTDCTKDEVARMCHHLLVPHPHSPAGLNTSELPPAAASLSVEDEGMRTAALLSAADVTRGVTTVQDESVVKLDEVKQEIHAVNEAARYLLSALDYNGLNLDDGFTRLDVDGDGILSLPELASAFDTLGITASRECLQTLHASMARGRNGADRNSWIMVMSMHGRAGSLLQYTKPHHVIMPMSIEPLRQVPQQTQGADRSGRMSVPPLHDSHGQVNADSVRGTAASHIGGASDAETDGKGGSSTNRDLLREESALRRRESERLESLEVSLQMNSRALTALITKVDSLLECSAHQITFQPLSELKGVTAQLPKVSLPLSSTKSDKLVDDGGARMSRVKPLSYEASRVRLSVKDNLSLTTGGLHL